MKLSYFGSALFCLFFLAENIKPVQPGTCVNLIQSGTTGIVKSFKWPAKYTRATYDCNWVITVDEPNKIEFQNISGDVGSGRLVFNNNGTGTTFDGIFSNGESQVGKSATNVMKIRMRVTRRESKPGFGITWVAVVPVCSPVCEYGVCVNDDECDCDEGFEGIDCSNDTNECTDGPGCADNAECTNNNGSYTCECLPGFTGSDAYDTGSCDNIDECADNTTCGLNALCTDTNGSHTCECMSGYTGDPLVECKPCKSLCDNDTLGIYCTACDPGDVNVYCFRTNGRAGTGKEHCKACEADDYLPANPSKCLRECIASAMAANNKLLDGVARFWKSCNRRGTPCNYLKYQRSSERFLIKTKDNCKQRRTDALCEICNA